jgi:glucose/arabinose dehydrogenase
VLLATLALVGFAASCAGSSNSTAAPGTTSDGLTSIGAGVRGPAGFAASVYASGLVNVAAFAFDDQQRLWASTAATTDKGDDAVYLVPQAGAAPVKVIAGLHTPLGLLWYQGALYVASKERVDAYNGLSGTTFAAHHAVVTFPTDVGELNGLALGPDGRISLGISAPCDSCVPTLPQSAAVVSFAPDGSALRTDATGIRAPVGLAFYPGTDDLFVTMNQRDDLGQKTPGDWLSVVQPGQAWGFPACYGQGGTDCHGVPSPVATLDAHAGVSGVAIVTGQLGATVGEAALVGEYVPGRVMKVALTKSGSVWTGATSLFLAGFQSAVPVALAADGALLVGDWSTGQIMRITVAR